MCILVSVWLYVTVGLGIKLLQTFERYKTNLVHFNFASSNDIGLSFFREMWFIDCSCTLFMKVVHVYFTTCTRGEVSSSQFMLLLLI